MTFRAFAPRNVTRHFPARRPRRRPGPAACRAQASSPIPSAISQSDQGTLLDRTTRRVDLTPAGEALLARATRLIADHRAAVEAVRDAAGSTTTLRLGLMGSSGADLIGPLLRRLGQERPELTIEPVALVYPAQVERGEADVAFARLRPHETNLMVEILASEPRMLAMAADHAFAGRDELEMAELGDEAFLTQPAAINPQWREEWLAEQHRHGLPGRIAAELTDAGQMFAFLAAGKGVCLVPEAASRAMARPGIAFVPVADAERAVVSLVWRDGTVSEALLRVLVDAARSLATAGADQSAAAPGDTLQR